MARRRRLSAQSELFALFTAEPSVRARMNSIKMVGVLMLDAQPTVAGVRAVVGEQLPSLERFMARCEFRPGEGAFMCWDRPVDIDYHVRALPETDGAGALSVADVEEIVRRVGLARFTPERPLWRLWVCARPLLSHAGEHVCAGAIFAVVDHALGDGASTVASLAHLLGASADELAASLPRSGRTRAPACASEPGERACAYVRTALAGARAREALRGLAVGLFAQFAPRDAPTPLQLARPLDVSSHAPFVLGSAPPVPLRLLREIAARFAGATVNDVAVSALALAVRRRLAQRAREEEAGAREEAGAKDGAGGQAVTRGEPAQRVHAAARRAGAWMPIGTAGRGPAARPPWAQHLRAAVSMSTRPAGEAVLKTSPGNRVGTLNVELPFCSPEPCPRSPDAAARWATALVHAAMAETRSLRLSPAPAITYAARRAFARACTCAWRAARRHAARGGRARPGAASDAPCPPARARRSLPRAPSQRRTQPSGRAAPRRAAARSRRALACERARAAPAPAPAPAAWAGAIHSAPEPALSHSHTASSTRVGCMRADVLDARLEGDDRLLQRAWPARAAARAARAQRTRPQRTRASTRAVNCRA